MVTCISKILRRQKIYIIPNYRTEQPINKEDMTGSGAETWKRLLKASGLYDQRNNRKQLAKLTGRCRRTVLKGNFQENLVPQDTTN